MKKACRFLFLLLAAAGFVFGASGRVPDDTRNQQNSARTTRDAKQSPAARKNTPHETANVPTNHQSSHGDQKRSASEKSDAVQQHNSSRPVQPTKGQRDGKNVKARTLEPGTLRSAQMASAGNARHHNINPARVGGPVSTHTSTAGIGGTGMGRQR